MFLRAEIMPLLESFRPVFTAPTYQKATSLVVGTILAKGRRTVTAALRVLGLAGDWAKYHHVLNRAQWAGLAVSAILLKLLVNTFVACEAVIYMSVDETLERQWGPQIKQRGDWRDSLASSRKLNVSTSGLRWLSVAVVVQVPWSPLNWALPFLHVLLTTPKVSAARGIRHRTVAKRTMQVVCWLRRTLSGRAIHLIGDGAYSVIELGLRCQANGITLIAPLRLDARLFDKPPAHAEKKRQGRPPCVGQRLPNLTAVATRKTTCWHRGQLDWHGGQAEIVDWATGTARWYSTGTPPCPIR